MMLSTSTTTPPLSPRAAGSAGSATTPRALASPASPFSFNLSPVAAASRPSLLRRSTSSGSTRRGRGSTAVRRAAANNNSNGSAADATSAGAAAAATATGGDVSVVALQAPGAGNEASPFLDPLIRSLFLGVGAGIACETFHVFLKAVTLAEAGSWLNPFSAAFIQQFSPAFVADHAVAIGAWVLLYAVEAAAIVSLLNRNESNKTPTDLSSALSALPSRKMFPASLTPVKDALAHTLAAGATAAATNTTTSSTSALSSASASFAAVAAAATAAAKPAAITAAPPGLSKELERTLDDIERAAAAAGKAGQVGAGVVAPAPPAPEETQQKPKEQQPKQSSPPSISSGPSVVKPRRQQQQQDKEQQQQQQSDKLSKRDQELRDRKAYLKNFWYAAALSQNVPADKPLGVDILGSRISLFRDETGQVVAVDDACPHRGAPLSDGWTSTDKATGKKCVVCPYHGWAFDSQGKLRDVPSAEQGSWPRRPLIGSYAVEERGGFVWLFYGSKDMPADERPPIPTTPELDDPNWRAVYGEIEFECGHWGVFENAIDMAHIHYLHADSFGNSEKPKVMDMSSTRDTFATTCTFRIHNKPVNKLWEWTSVPSVPVTAKAMLPSTSAVTIELAHGVKMITFVNTVPISATRAINRFCLIRNFATSPAFDFMARDNMYKILGEDKVMVDKLAPERLEAEYSLAPDLPQIAFRQLRQEWIEMGYGVPPETELPRRGLLPRDC